MGVVHIVVLIIVFLAVILWFGFVFGMMFSPKIRSKFMGHQLKMRKQMLEDNKETIEELGKLSGKIGVKTTKGVIDENESDLTQISRKTADINKEAITETVKAVKEGLEEENIYCKNCGESIDSDSTFCKKCGKKQ